MAEPTLESPTPAPLDEVPIIPKNTLRRTFITAGQIEIMLADNGVDGSCLVVASIFGEPDGGLRQVSTRIVPGFIFIRGDAVATTDVKVNFIVIGSAIQVP